MPGNNKYKVIQDAVAGKVVFLLSTLLALMLLTMIAGLVMKSLPVLENNSLLDILTSSEWKPMKGKFGMLPFIMGTLWVTGISVIIAVPLCLLASVYFSEYAHKNFLKIINPLIDILAGIPSVVYGVWGILFIVPFIREYISPALGMSSTGYSVLAGGFVLALMIVPVIIHVLNEVFKTVPVEVREASLSLGATRWQTVKYVVMRRAMPGVIAAVVLGLSRAFGETMAVLMVVGNVVQLPHSLLDSGYPLPALIANNYGEMMSIPSYDSALMMSALLLLIIVIFFNLLSRMIVLRIEKMVGGTV